MGEVFAGADVLMGCGLVMSGFSRGLACSPVLD
jgi:hypothetical protein